MKPNEKINVAILDDHQSILDGYMMRLSQDQNINIVAAMVFADELEPALENYPTDVLILDVSVPISLDNPMNYPILHVIPRILNRYPKIHILVISEFEEQSLIDRLVKAGVSGYILKNDRATLIGLTNVVYSIANGGNFFSEKAKLLLLQHRMILTQQILSDREAEALSLCASYPDSMTTELAMRMSISTSTLRNLLARAAHKLGVGSRSAAISKAQSLGIITPIHQYWVETPE